MPANARAAAAALVCAKPARTKSQSPGRKATTVAKESGKRTDDTLSVAAKLDNGGRLSPFRRAASLGKGPQRVTTPQGPQLATEARSFARPCGCGKPGNFKHHEHHKKDAAHSHGITETEKIRKPRSTITKKNSTPRTVPAVSEDVKKFISTLVWYPKLEPQLFSTTFEVSKGRKSSFTDTVVFKLKFAEAIHVEKEMKRGKAVSSYSNTQTGSLNSSQLIVQPVAVL